LFASSTQAVAGRLRGMVTSVSERVAVPVLGFLGTRMFLGTIDVTIAGHSVGRFVAAKGMHGHTSREKNLFGSCSVGILGILTNMLI
jgi:hypothetical protein